jgi:hypothetical protein
VWRHEGDVGYVVYREVTYDVRTDRPTLVSCPVFVMGASVSTARNFYSESLERVRSVLVFFATPGRANAAVLAELESEVRVTVSAARMALLPIDDVQADLDRIAALTLPEVAAGTASRMMRGWLAMASERMNVDTSSGASADRGQQRA